MGKVSFPSWCFSCTCFSSSSLPQDQPANAEPSTASATDLQIVLYKFNNLSRLQDLIKFVEGLLKNVMSYQSKDSLDGLSEETQKIVIKLLEGAGKIHWVGAALSMVGFVLARFNEMCNNKRECLGILKAMVNLGRQIVELNEQMPDQKQKLNEAVECIVEGCCLCTSQILTSNIFRLLTSSVTADSLKAFQLRIDRLYSDLQMWGIICQRKLITLQGMSAPTKKTPETCANIPPTADINYFH